MLLNKIGFVFSLLISLNAVAGLKVYMADGVTVLGNLVTVGATDSTSCNALTYSNTTTGAISQLEPGACSTITTHTVYFSNSNCTGTHYIPGGPATARFKIGTGNTAAVCITNGSFINFYTYSYRTWSGACVNTGGTYQTSAHSHYPVGDCITYTDVCGGSPCVVKP